ncbi:MAG: FimV/HubP family polar landmark protein [Burkholderiaceae bacterium]
MHKNIVQSHEGLPVLTATPPQPLIKKAALASAVALALLGVSLDAQALALGAISVRSALGEPLRAEIEIPQISSEEASTLQASMGTPQAFRAAGVDYSPALAGARVTLQRRPNGQAYLRIIGSRPVNEPYVGVVIEANWANGRVVRDYTLLLDPPGREALPAVVATQPQAPAAEPSAAPARPAVAEQIAPRTSAVPAAKAPSRPERTATSTARGGEQVTIQKGDTLSRIAGDHGIDGVSLDQMMLALLQANPQAFIRGNVNLIKAGAVLQMPSAEQAQATSRQAARRAVLAQSKDFQAYRHAVARAAPAQPQDAGGGHTASGSVQAQVRDRQAPAPAPDQLKISKGGTAGGAETTVARSRQAQEQADREAELKRNISALENLKGAASAPATPTTPPPAASVSSDSPSVNVPLGASAISAAATAASAATAAAAADTSASAASDVAPAAVMAAASTPEPGASVAAAAEAPAAATAATPSEVASSVAPATAASAAVATTTPKPKAATPAPAPVAEASFLDGLMDNPLLPVAGAGLIALLAGLGIYRARQRKQKDAALDSEFIESRLQPDSFFGASGGQQVNTKERPSGSSSMAYSPSQLDAAGDVDPVAEADVYLAYGRDMQAEEILKEALLTHPGRISVHRKLAEIYAKRRDARALEAIATEAHALTQGDGPDWQAIASLGAELDPNNPMYKPGGMPVPKVAPAGTRRQFGADTEPQTAQVILSKDGAASTGRPPLDLNLDLGDSVRQAAPKASAPPAGVGAAAVAAATGAAVGAVAAAASSAPTSARQALETPAPVKADSEFVDLDLGMDFAPPSELALAAAPAPAPSVSAAPPASNSGMIEFDMDALSIDPDSRSGDIKTEQPNDADEDPLSTKLSLAQEFRAIGDIDGARSLASEVVAEAVGALKIRAERFLTEL